MIRVTIPTNLQKLADAEREILVQVEEDTGSISTVLDALEERYPMLRGTIRDHVTKERRPFIRFFACGEDLSHQPPEAPLPEAVTTGDEPLRIVGALAGG